MHPTTPHRECATSASRGIGACSRALTPLAKAKGHVCSHTEKVEIGSSFCVRERHGHVAFFAFRIRAEIRNKLRRQRTVVARMFSVRSVRENLLMAITVSLIFLPIWNRVREYLHIVECAKDGGIDEPRIRIEFLGLPDRLSRELVMIETSCVSCERPVHPLRRRIGDGWDRLYYAPACPVAVRAACSRSRAAMLEYERFKSPHIQRPPEQLSLFG